MWYTEPKMAVIELQAVDILTSSEWELPIIPRDNKDEF